MKVYVAINYTREHQHIVVGAALAPDACREMLETARSEPLRLLPDGQVENYAADGHPDWVGHVATFDLGETKAEAACKANDAVVKHFSRCQQCGCAPFRGEVWFCAEHDRLKMEAIRLTTDAMKAGT